MLLDAEIMLIWKYHKPFPIHGRQQMKNIIKTTESIIKYTCMENSILRSS